MKKMTEKMENRWALNLMKNHGQKEMDKNAIKEFRKDPENFNYGKWTVSEELLREFADKVDWYYAVETQNLSEEFLREMKKHFKKSEWYWISKHYNFSTAFLKDFAKKLKWDEMSHNLTEEQIDKFVDKVDWRLVSRRKQLTKEFAKRHVKDIDWTEYYLGNYDFTYQGCFLLRTADEVEKAAKKYKGMFC